MSDLWLLAAHGQISLIVVILSFMTDRASVGPVLRIMSQVEACDVVRVRWAGNVRKMVRRRHGWVPSGQEMQGRGVLCWV